MSLLIQSRIVLMLTFSSLASPDFVTIMVERATEHLAIKADFLRAEFTRTKVGLDALIRTFVNQVQNFAIRESALAALPDFDWVQVSILDSRTSPICKEYSQLAWTKEFEPIGHDLPFRDGSPRHWNCRSLVVPRLANETLPAITFDAWFDGLGAAERDLLFGKNEVRLYRRKLLSIGDLVREAGRGAEAEGAESIMF